MTTNSAGIFEKLSKDLFFFFMVCIYRTIQNIINVWRRTPRCTGKFQFCSIRKYSRTFITSKAGSENFRKILKKNFKPWCLLMQLVVRIGGEANELKVLSNLENISNCFFFKFQDIVCLLQKSLLSELSSLENFQTIYRVS